MVTSLDFSLDTGAVRTAKDVEGQHVFSKYWNKLQSISLSVTHYVCVWSFHERHLGLGAGVHNGCELIDLLRHQLILSRQVSVVLKLDVVLVGVA